MYVRSEKSLNDHSGKGKTELLFKALRYSRALKI